MWQQSRRGHHNTASANFSDMAHEPAIKPEPPIPSPNSMPWHNNSRRRASSPSPNSIIEALTIREHAWGPAHAEVAPGLDQLADVYIAQGKHAEAEALLQRVLTIREQQEGPEHQDVATTLEKYAALLRQMRRDAAAQPLEARAQAIRAQPTPATRAARALILSLSEGQIPRSLLRPPELFGGLIPRSCGEISFWPGKKVLWPACDNLLSGAAPGRIPASMCVQFTRHEVRAILWQHKCSIGISNLVPARIIDSCGSRVATYALKCCIVSLSV